MFYDNYIRLCNSVNKTPSAVAIEMGISKTSVNRWKNGSYPTDATMLRIAKYFNVTVDVLKSGEHFEQKETPTPKNGSERAYDRTYEDNELNEAFKRADEATRAAIRLLLKLK